MLEIDEKVNEVKSFLFNDSSFNEDYAKVWFGTTESIKSYFELLNWEKVSRVLTVCSSGDHVLNLINKGIIQIDTFDINPLTYPYLKLKIGLILALPYEKYINFFERLSIASSSEKKEYEMFSEIKDFIPIPYDYFWEQLFYDNLKKNRHDIMQPGLLGKLCMNYIPFNVSMLRNQYLSSEEEYEKTRENLGKCNITFQIANLLELCEEFSGNYDKIFLSNISDYLPFPLNLRNSKFDKFIKNKLSGLLSNSGEIIAAYIYHYIDDYEYRGIHFKNSYDDDVSVFKKGYQLEEIAHISNFGENSSGEKDAVLIYRKR